ncbi:alpha/beta hydrolase [Gordonia sp. L191]|uniref:alpha/beta fold hydrolase n=1 Tax=Gordonia sp. L191 TaxID=2982699 RepID=UPI0024C0A158|nr:alpha/beta hydrolase [Gordonia sp. L191]WHU47086.1 alpha/beta hydrolase [Gordonia sp. L191]
MPGEPIATRQRIGTSLVNFEVVSVEAEAAAGDPVLLVHGWPDGPASWLPLARHIAGHGLRVLVPAWPGVGGSAAVGVPVRDVASQAGLVRALTELVAAIGVNGPVHLVGHDWGALASFGVAATAPSTIASLTALGAGWSPRSAAAELPAPEQLHMFWYQWLLNTPMGERYLATRRAELVAHLWRQWSPEWHFETGEPARAVAAFGTDWADATIGYYRNRWWWGEAASREELAGTDAALAAARRITVPTQLIHGERDGCFALSTSRATERFVEAHYRHTALPGVGHFPHREAPDESAGLILDWLERYRDG